MLWIFDIIDGCQLGPLLRPSVALMEGFSRSTLGLAEMRRHTTSQQHCSTEAAGLLLRSAPLAFRFCLNPRLPRRH